MVIGRRLFNFGIQYTQILLYLYNIQYINVYINIEFIYVDSMRTHGTP